MKEFDANKISLDELIKSKNEISKSINRIEHLLKHKNFKTKKNIITKSFNSTKSLYQVTKMKIREADVTEIFKNNRQFDDLSTEFQQLTKSLEKIEETLKMNDSGYQLKQETRFNQQEDSLDESLQSFTPSKEKLSLSRDDVAFLETQSKIQNEKMHHMELLEEEMRGLHSAQVDIHQLLTEQGESLIGSNDQLENATKYVDYGVTEIHAVSFKRYSLF